MSERPPPPDEPTVPGRVRAQVLEDAGLGALWGLAAGDALGRIAAGEAGPTEDALALAEMFMARGDYHPEDASWPSGRRDAIASLSRAAVTALFYAGWADKRTAVAVADAGDDLEAALVCAAHAGALAASVWANATPIEQLAGALADLGAATVALDTPDRHAALVAAHERVRASIEAAVTEAGPVDVGEARGVLAFALRALILGREPEGALNELLTLAGAGSTHGAAVAALLGARVGRAALPARWVEAARTRPVEELAAFVATGPFRGW